MKFVDRCMISSGERVREHVDAAHRHALLRQGALGINVKIMLPRDPTGNMGARKLLPDAIAVLEPQKEYAPPPSVIPYT